MTYGGSVDIEDFELVFDIFIVRSENISFTFTGHDDDGRFTGEGMAHINPEGKYHANSIELVYKKYISHGEHQTERASLAFNTVDEKSSNCIISGKWLQNGEKWDFSGNLEACNSQEKAT